MFSRLLNYLLSLYEQNKSSEEQDEHYIRKHEREGSDRHRDGNSSYNSYLVPITTPNHLVELVGTFAKKNEE